MNASDRECISVIQKHDLYCQEIIERCSKCVLYKFHKEKNAWEKTNVEGPLYVYKRTMSPFHGFIILGTKNGENKVQVLSPNILLQENHPFLLYRIDTEVVSLWFSSKLEFDKISSKLRAILPSPVDKAPTPSQGILQVPASSSSHSTVGLNAALHNAFNRNAVGTGTLPLTKPQQSPTVVSASVQNPMNISILTRAGDGLERPGGLENPMSEKQEPKRTSWAYGDIKNGGGSSLPSTGASSTKGALLGLLHQELMKKSPGESQSRTVLQHSQPHSSGTAMAFDNIPPPDISSQLLNNASSVSSSKSAVNNSYSLNSPKFQSPIESEPPPLLPASLKKLTAPLTSTASVNNHGNPPLSLCMNDLYNQERTTLQTSPNQLLERFLDDDDELVAPDMFLSSATKEFIETPSEPQPEVVKSMDFEHVGLTKQQLQKTLVFLLENDADFIDAIHSGYVRMLQHQLSRPK